MELQIIMDAGAETLNEAMWFTGTPSPPYEQLSPNRPTRCNGIVAQQASSLGYNDPEDSLWQGKQNSLKSSSEDANQIRSSNESPRHLSSSPGQTPSQQNVLKRRAGEPVQHISELDRKHTRRNGSIGSNGSGHGWSTQVEELAEHLADFDGSLSALAASDLATAVASYNMRFPRDPL